ncbi:hypothetical protein Q5Y75_17295 [Ruegeria sp. 2205SS24-7]|uniref:hypothetical protein n=1 Tax=Ruegeria discodermiae TaxID=3064389 RepID=UPI0027421A08|nr:hypothetical protein [Ruegeria sp. 2205SS24-7]MDP5218978.1 hypothetical protein [Ruegeria sp. 2205SS24-7]
MNLFETTVLRNVGASDDAEVSNAILARAKVLGMTQDAEDAVLRPKDFGAFDHDLRAALAARIAFLAGDEPLAAHYHANSKNYSALTSPSEKGISEGLDEVLSFVDKVANQTKDIAAEDISRLQASGVSDADIVRLCELVAFMAFQTRVIAGLRLMQREAA